MSAPTLTPLVEPTADVVAFQVTTDQASLTEALKALKFAVPSRPPMPILTCVLIDATDGQVRLSTFDYEIALTEVIAGTGHGRALVSHPVLLDMVKGLAKGCPIVLSEWGGKIEVEGDGVTYTIPTADLSDYPQLPGPAAYEMVTLSAATVGSLVDVASCASTDLGLPILATVHLDVRDGLVARATDRYRLAEFIDASVPQGLVPAALVPAARVRLLPKLFKGLDVTVRVDVSAHHDGTRYVDRATFTAGTRMLSVLCVEGQYPRVASLFPSQFKTQATVASAALAKGLAQVAKACERNAAVRLATEDGSLVLRAGQSGEVSARKALPADVAGEDVATAVNPGFLADIIKVIGGTQVMFSVTEAQKPVVLSDPERPSFRVLLMPVRVAV